MQRRFKLIHKDSAVSSIQSYVSNETHKEVSRDMRVGSISQIDMSMTPLSGFRDITNFTNGDSSLNLRNAKRNLEAARRPAKRIRQELKKNLERAKSFDAKVKKSRVSSAKAELQSIKSEYMDKEDEDSSVSSKLRFENKDINFKGIQVRNKSTKSDSSKGDPLTKQYPMSQPAKSLAISEHKIDAELRRSVLVNTTDIYNKEVKDKVKRRFTDAVQSLPYPQSYPKRSIVEYTAKERTRKKNELIREYYTCMNMTARLIRITLPIDNKSRYNRLDRVRYPRLLPWLGEMVVDIAKDSVLVRRVPYQV